MELSDAITLVSDEVARAQSIYGAFTSAHEGYAVLLEELDELKAEVWKSPRSRDYDAMLIEAKQVAAMAIRLMIEIAAPQVTDEYRHKAQVDTKPRPRPGEQATCSQCGDKIGYIGAMWDHAGNPINVGYWTHLGKLQPKYPAIPVEYAL